MRTAAGVIGALVLLGPGAGVERFPIYEGGKFGFMDRTGTVVVSPRYNGAWQPTEGLAAVQVGRVWGFVDEAGRMMFSSPPREGVPSAGFVEVLDLFRGGGTGLASYKDKVAIVGLAGEGSSSLRPTPSGVRSSDARILTAAVSTLLAGTAPAPVDRRAGALLLARRAGGRCRSSRHACRRSSTHRQGRAARRRDRAPAPSSWARAAGTEASPSRSGR